MTFLRSAEVDDQSQAPEIIKIGSTVAIRSVALQATRALNVVQRLARVLILLAVAASAALHQRLQSRAGHLPRAAAPPFRGFLFGGLCRLGLLLSLCGRVLRRLSGIPGNGLEQCDYD
jgi:hypothetical protein